MKTRYLEANKTYTVDELRSMAVLVKDRIRCYETFLSMRTSILHIEKGCQFCLEYKTELECLKHEQMLIGRQL